MLSFVFSKKKKNIYTHLHMFTKETLGNIIVNYAVHLKLMCVNYRQLKKKINTGRIPRN